MTLKEMRAKRKANADRMKAISDLAVKEARALTADEQKEFDTLDGEYRDFSKRIDTAERAAEIETEQRTTRRRGSQTPGLEDTDTRETRDDEDDEEPEVAGRLGRWAQADHEERADAVRGWMRTQAGIEPTRRQRRAADTIGLRLNRNAIDIPLLTTSELRSLQRMSPEQRLQQSGVGSSGGYTVAPSFMARAEVAMLAFGGLRAEAEVLRTETGSDLPWPTSDDTSNEGEQIGEGEDGTEQDIAFKQKVWKAYKFSSKPLKVSHDLMEDSAFDVGGLIEQMLGERIGRRLARGYAQGTGAATIEGIIVGAQTGKTAASTTAITADELMEFQHSIDPAYRANAKWLMHDNTFLSIRKLKDGEGNYLLVPGIGGAASYTLLGSPIRIDNSMPSSLAASAVPIVYGDLAKYKIRDVRSMRLVRMNERYADEDAVGFVAFQRSDGKLLDAGTGPVKKLVMAAS